ncbi:MAG: hypothetical protein M5U09_01485 [Gammaproteobacteria bacterium]|nr:hypothetical protein [Gammaproteobacteria bacterium]
MFAPTTKLSLVLLGWAVLAALALFILLNAMLEWGGKFVLGYGGQVLVEVPQDYGEFRLEDVDRLGEGAARVALESVLASRGALRRYRPVKR